MAEHLCVDDIFTMEEGFPAEDRAALESYLAPFANPKRDGKFSCINCSALGVAYRWGLVHGEGTCSGCGWPARGIHYIKREDGTELCTLRNLFLPYHPDQVERASGEEREGE